MSSAPVFVERECPACRRRGIRELEAMIAVAFSRTSETVERRRSVDEPPTSLCEGRLLGRPSL
jgi:hypothetical protein